MFRKLISFIFITFVCHQVFATNNVVLQLQSEHSFQFAGYYAAKWQGFYAEQGLDVEIKPLNDAQKSNLNPNNELIEGHAQFAIGDSELLFKKSNGDNPVLLASIFQHNPIALFSLEKTDISSIEKLSKLRIAGVNTAFSKMQIESLLATHQYDLSNIKFVNQPATIDTLLQNKADVIIANNISTKYLAQEQKLKLNRLFPGDFSLAFYGDTLYTSLAYSKMHPEKTKKFTEASIKGWKYALSHKEEIVKAITNKLPHSLDKYKDTYSYNLAFSREIDELIDVKNIPLGYVNKTRWLNLNNKMRSLGVLSSHLNHHLFNVTDNYHQHSKKPLFYYLLIIAALLPFIIFLWYRKKRTLTIIMIIISIFICEIHFEKIFLKEEKIAGREETTQKLNYISTKLQSYLQNELSLLKGFAAYISATPNLSQKDYDNYAKALFKKSSIIINFAAAKNLVINYIYPLAGNEAAMGLNYREVPNQFKTVKEVIETKEVHISDPVKLIQGGTAFLGQAPVFLENGTLWGIVSAPFDTNLLFKYLGIDKTRGGIQVAIRSFSIEAKKEKVFFGNADIFNDPNKSITTIQIEGSSWQIAVRQVNKHDKTSLNIYLLRACFLILALIISLLIWFKFTQISEKQAFEQTLREDKFLSDSVSRVSKIGGWKIDNQFNFLKWSQQASFTVREIKEFSPKTLKELEIYFLEVDYQLLLEKIASSITTSTPFDLTLRLKIKTEKPLWVRLISDAEKLDNENSIVGTIQDVTDKVLNDRQLEHQASYDSLTDLPNRRTYQDKLKQAIMKTYLNNQKLAVLFIDLDFFKPINDNHGHQAGDKILIEASTRLKNIIRKSDTVSRLSGDEFALIINNIEDEKQILNIAEKISDEMQLPYQLDQIQVHLSVSIGVAIYPDNSDYINPIGNTDALLKKADQAMYEVKENGRNGYQLYTQKMQLKSEYRHDLLNQLIIAVKNKALQAYFQPIIDLKTNRIQKCETLARWESTQGVFISPFEFINLAEESGLINKIDLFMLNEAGQTLSEMDKKIELSINVSPRLFHTRDHALENWINSIEVISKSINITVEITERLLTCDSGKVLRTLNQLKELGIKIAIDDFGTGYSALNYLMKFPVDIIKIDRSFIKNIGKHKPSETLIETIIVMANKLEIKVVAEGIETEKQLNYLRKYKCDYGQGYLLGKPMSKDSFQSLLKKTTL